MIIEPVTVDPARPSHKTAAARKAAGHDGKAN